ncbi:MAG TPA: hypothetical protein VLA19_25530 [Herpetosiphonaceae bacterium]|nr:hypothetical protein [Herpetosiphonaceae bacterium]
MTATSRFQPNQSLDVIAAVDGDQVFVELDVRHNDQVRVGDQYMVRWADGATTFLRVIGFKSAEEYTNTIARRIDSMREGVVGVPNTLTARKAYQTKIAVMRIEGELQSDGRRIIGPSRVPDVMVPIERISDDLLEQFVTTPNGNLLLKVQLHFHIVVVTRQVMTLLLGNLRSGRRVLHRVARIRHNYAGERMVILGMPGKGKTQLVRGLLAQAMAEE